MWLSLVIVLLCSCSGNIGEVCNCSDTGSHVEGGSADADIVGDDASHDTDVQTEEGLPDTEGPLDAMTSCEPDPGASRALGEPCCPDHGADACEAGLFCAAFDDQTIHACYEEHSRLDGESCDDDSHCASTFCDPETNLCATAETG